MIFRFKRYGCTTALESHRQIIAGPSCSCPRSACVTVQGGGFHIWLKVDDGAGARRL